MEAIRIDETERMIDQYMRAVARDFIDPETDSIRADLLANDAILYLPLIPTEHWIVRKVAHDIGAAYGRRPEA